ncbi:hypothetical protein KAS31_04135 [Candidatus Parcubacteria bacterium]|nr:hypothetical protein [Candidatus Parcubacteria bacterium]
MKKNKIIISVFSVVSLVFSSFASVTVANDVDPVVPAIVIADLPVGGTMDVTKTVTTPEIPPLVDVCLLEDETGSFWDDIAHLQGGTTASDIYDSVTDVSPDAQFAVAGFRDYPVTPHGMPGDWVYRLLSPMSSTKASWLAGIGLLSAGGGWDEPEAQYDAIVAAATGDDNCGWRDPVSNPGIQRVLIVTTDAPFHLPGTGKPHINTQASTLAALDAENIIVIGLKAPGAGGELITLAAATGGSVQPLSSNGENIAQAILDGLEEVTTDVWAETACDVGLTVSLVPDVFYDVSGGTILTFDETITVADDLTPDGRIMECTVTFIANEYPKEGTPIGTQKIEITIPDNTPPEISCVETVNPSGKNIPPAGSTTLPGSKGGQNEDGFYQLITEDVGDPDVEICIGDEDGTLLGCYASGTNVKYTEMASAPRVKPWGSAKSFVEWHIFGNGDMVIYATDSAGNVSSTTCLVPPPPK